MLFIGVFFTFSFIEWHKYWQIDKQGHHRECCTANSSHRKGKPEDVLRAIVEERHKAQNGRYDGERDRQNLVVIGHKIEPETPLVRGESTLLRLGDKVYSRIDHNSAQQHKGRKATLVKTESRKAKHQEHTDKRNGNHHNNHQRAAQRLKYNGAHCVDNGNHQQYEFYLRLLLVGAVGVTRLQGRETKWHNLLVEGLDGLFD